MFVESAGANVIHSRTVCTCLHLRTKEQHLKHTQQKSRNMSVFEISVHWPRAVAFFLCFQ